REDIVVPPDLVSSIAERGWPGNVRELRNAADRGVLGLDAGRGDHAASLREDRSRLADKVVALERTILARALAAHGGALRPVYQTIGISRKTLYEKMQKYGLDKRMLGLEHPPGDERDG